MGHNREGSTGQARSTEWGSKARKDEARDRGFNNQARRDAIAEHLADMADDLDADRVPLPAPNAADEFADPLAVFDANVLLIGGRQVVTVGGGF
jgi:hypothetical protein